MVEHRHRLTDDALACVPPAKRARPPTAWRLLRSPTPPKRIVVAFFQFCGGWQRVQYRLLPCRGDQIVLKPSWTYPGIPLLVTVRPPPVFRRAVFRGCWSRLHRQDLEHILKDLLADGASCQLLLDLNLRVSDLSPTT